MSSESTKAIAQTTEALVSISVDKTLKTDVHVDGIIVWCMLGLIFVFIAIRVINIFNLRSFEINEAEFGLGNQKIKLKPNSTDMQIAYKIWVELSTRKIGLPVDFKNDVVTEVYDSWYSFFAVTRELIKEVPVSKFRRKETEAIIQLSIEVLNSGIRPHLTLWQAKFRRWYEHEIEKDENREASPQEIQQKFVEYNQLVSDLRIVNQRLIQYRKKLHELITAI